MPTDASGNYALPPSYLATTGTTIQTSEHNPVFEDVAAAMTARLPRSGSAPMSGPLRLSDGSVSAPALTFATDPTTGLYKTASGGIGVSIAGAKVSDLRFQLPIGLGPLPWSLSTTPAGWVLCFGQTLLRATYPELWALAAVELTAGNTLYNNGNGTTTFGIADLRGRTTAAIDAMGGTPAGRLTNVFLANPNQMGGAGGADGVTLISTQIPPITPSGSVIIDDPGHGHILNARFATSSGGGSGIFQTSNFVGTANILDGAAVAAVTGITATFSGNTFGGGGAHVNLQPTILTQYILFAGA